MDKLFNSGTGAGDGQFLKQRAELHDEGDLACSENLADTDSKHVMSIFYPLRHRAAMKCVYFGCCFFSLIWYNSAREKNKRFVFYGENHRKNRRVRKKTDDMTRIPVKNDFGR